MVRTITVSVSTFISEKLMREQTKSQKNFFVDEETKKKWKYNFEKLFILSNFISSAAILLCNFFHYFLVEKCEKNYLIDESIINKQNIEHLLGFLIGKKKIRKIKN